MYLTGFCLFLSLVLARTFYIIQDLIHVQDEYAKLKTAVRSFSLTSPRHVIIDPFDQTANNSRSNVVANDQTKEIERLKKDLGKPFAFHDQTHLNGFYTLSESLKQQARSQAAEYDRLADQYNKETGQPVSNKRTD